MADPVLSSSSDDEDAPPLPSTGSPGAAAPSEMDPSIEEALSRLVAIIPDAEGCLVEEGVDGTTAEASERCANLVLTADTLLESLTILLDFPDDVEPPAWAVEKRELIETHAARIGAVRASLRSASHEAAEAERLAQLAATAESLTFPKDVPTVELADPSSPRRHIMTSELVKKGTKSFFKRNIARDVMLFDDVIVMADKGGSPRRPAAVHGVLFLKSVVVVNLTASEDEPEEHAFQLNDTAGRTFVLVAPSAEVKQQWLRELTRCLVKVREAEAAAEAAGGEGGASAAPRRTRHSMQHHLVQGTLHSAAMLGRTDMLTQLLAKGLSKAELNALDDGGMAPLHLASHGGHATAVDMLLDAGATVDLIDESDLERSALYIAVAKGCDASTATDASAAARFSAVVEALLQRGADVNGVDIRDRTPLRLAVAAFVVAPAVRLEVCALAVQLLKAGAKVVSRDDSGTSLLQLIARTSLESASADGSAAAMAAATMLDKGAKVDEVTKMDGRSALHHVCAAGALHVFTAHMLCESCSQFDSLRLPYSAPCLRRRERDATAPSRSVTALRRATKRDG